MTPTEQAALSSYLWKLTDWCLAHRSKHVLQGSRDVVFRYVAFCHLVGKMAVKINPVTKEIEACAFYWSDFKERIEAKAENNMQQFEWAKTHQGDALFVAECIGSRKAIAAIYASAIENFPNLITVPIFTFRKGKLVELSKADIERFIKERL